jgi:ABC-type molybdate transport system substrate-binding protein
MQRLFEDVRPAFEAFYGQKLNIEFASTLAIAKRVQGGEVVDFVITSRAGVESLEHFPPDVGQAAYPACRK